MSQAVPAARRRRMEDVTYNAREVAAMARVSERTISRLAAKRAIPGMIRVGASLRFSRSIIDAWLKTARTPGD